MNSTNHNLIIQIDAEFPDIYLGVYSIQTIDSSYLISFAALNSVPCYNDCLTNGRCSTGNCICSSGYIGKDCGQESKSLHIDQESNFQVEALDGHYANLRMSAKDDKLKMTITSQSFVYIYSKPGSSKHKSLLPNQIEYTNVNAGTSLSFTISQDGFTD